MNKNSKKLFTFLIIALSFASCRKEEAIVATTTETSATQELVYPSIKNGRLNFPTMDAFRNYMSAIQKLPIEEVEAMNVSHGFKSHYASGKGAADISSRSLGTRNTVVDDYIPDSYFGAVLNEAHQVLVQDYTWEANNDYSYMVPEGAEDNILSFETALANGMVKPEDIPTDGQYYNSNLYVYPTNATLQISESLSDDKNGKPLNTRGLLSTRQIQWTYFNNTEDWRLHAEAWRASWLLYASIGVESKCNRVANFFSLWQYYVNRRITSLGLGYTGTQTVNLSFSQPQPGNITQPANSNSTVNINGQQFDVQNVNYIFKNLANESLHQSKFDWQTATISTVVTLPFRLIFQQPNYNSIAKLRVVGMKLDTRHEGNYNGVSRRINMSVEIKP